MKVFVICSTLFLLLTVLVITLSWLEGARVEEIEKLAANAAECTLSGQEEEATLLFDSLKKEWHALQPKLTMTIHHSTIKPVQLAVTDAENAHTLQNRDAFYAALVRLSRALETLADDIRLPAL